MFSAEEIGKRIRDRRIELGLTLQDVADRVEVQNSTIYRYEQGAIKKPKIPVIEAIASALRVSPGYLLGKPDLILSVDQQASILRILDSACDRKDITHGFAIVRAQVEHDFFPKLKQLRLNHANMYDILAVAKYLEVSSEILEVIRPAVLPDNIVEYTPTHRIPILGRISAGQPLYAEEDIEGYTYTDLNGGAEYFALKVTGDSMNSARINDGDTLIVRCQDYVDNNQIAVVMVNDNEATVKRFHQQGSQVTLIPQSTNPIHQPQIYDTSVTNVRVIGLVVRNQISF